MRSGSAVVAVLFFGVILAGLTAEQAARVGTVRHLLRELAHCLAAAKAKLRSPVL
jgi:hypothetical protein